MTTENEHVKLHLLCWITRNGDLAFLKEICKSIIIAEKWNKM